MNIGIIVAMDKELQLLLPLLNNARPVLIDDTEFHLGDIAGHSVVVMKSGIGKVNAALSTKELIAQFAPDLVINTGVAGGTGSDAGILDLVVATDIAYHDVWCGPGTEPGQAARCPHFFHSDATVVALECIAPSEHIHHGLIASGDIFVSHPEDVSRILSLYPEAKAVDMESAAIAHTCYLMKTPFFCMRVVSDTPGGVDNMAQYENFWDDAPRQTFDILTSILHSLPKPQE